MLRDAQSTRAAGQAHQSQAFGVSVSDLTSKHPGGVLAHRQPMDPACVTAAGLGVPSCCS